MTMNKSLTLFSKNIRFGTIHILRQLGGSEKVQNYAFELDEWCLENIAYSYLCFLRHIYIQTCFLSSLFACGRAELLEIHISDVFLHKCFRVFFDDFFTLCII